MLYHATTATAALVHYRTSIKILLYEEIFFYLVDVLYVTHFLLSCPQFAFLNLSIRA